MSGRPLVKILLALLSTWILTELGLRAFPGLLPRRYLALFPMHGVEFFEPGILERTPIQGLPLPLVTGPHRGPPPADLVALGIAPAGEGSDARAFPDVEIPADSLGLPNPSELERADLVLIGDSFAVAMGAVRPRGLQARLAERTGLTVFDAGVAGVGPVQERWLVEEVALAKRPRCVLWFFFSGNDVTASYEPLLHRREGRTTWAQAYAERRKPLLVLPDLVRSWVRRPAASEHPALPGFRFRLADGREQPLWFHPDHVRQLGWSRAEWEAHPVWEAVQQELCAARDACERKEARFLLVYLPSKAEVYLPRVERDPALVLSTAGATLAEPLAVEPQEFLVKLLANRHALEELVREFCAAEELPFLSATPALEALAERGQLGYLVTDTHWQDAGQEALLEPLLEFLRREKVIGQ